MTQEDKSLLLQDLCARLPYKVVIEYNNDGCSSTRELGLGSLHDFICDNAECKPYLRPMSSMTEEEWEYLRLLKNELVDCDETNDEKFNRILTDIKEFYYSRHIDRNGLIPKGLALEAPKDMYNVK